MSGYVKDFSKNKCMLFLIDDKEIIMKHQDPWRDPGIAEAKSVLDVLENETKANFEENVPDKVRFQGGLNMG